MNYQTLGFKCGIEIHQRLDTEKKLFCSCRPKFSEDKPTKEIVRRLRTVPGELGEVDIAAFHEFLRGRKFIYQIFDKEDCLVETDEEPPHEMNEEALVLGLTVSKMLKCEIPDEIHVMRKTVIDGSNTTGFQRTALVGLNGKMETSKGVVRISNVSVEEESAGIVSQKDSNIVYRLDRLGIPLVEIGTFPDIRDPEHAKEVAEKIGMLLRSLKVQRGIGTIRQDINVSIREGARIEIKGVQELDMIPEIVRKEIQRQISLIELKDELKRKKAKISDIYDVTDTFKETKNKIIKNSISSGGKVFAIKLEAFGGILKKELCEGKTLGNELADYARAYGSKGMIHTDENLEKYGLVEEFEKLRKEMNASESDAIVIIAGGKEAETSIDAVRKRCIKLLEGVPEETRAAKPDGTTKYARPLPGAGRMYPETDVPPISAKLFKKIKIPETLEKKAKRFLKILPEEMVEPIIKSEYLFEFEKLSKKYDPVIVANTFISIVKDLKREGFEVEKLNENVFDDIFLSVKKGKISKEGIPEILKVFCRNPNLKIDDAISMAGLKKITEEELEKIIDKIFKENPVLVRQNNFSALMGLVMKIVRGKIDGKLVAEKIKKKLK